MHTPKLQFNLLTFDLPTTTQTWYFNSEPARHLTRIHVASLPDDIKEAFPDEAEFLYTSFNSEVEGLSSFELDLTTAPPELVKKYYDNKVYRYFKRELRLITRRGFINETIVWLPAAEKHPCLDVYDCFSLRVQLGGVTSFPELLLSYDGRARVARKSIKELNAEVEPGSYKWVLQKGNVFPYKKMKDFEEPDYATAFPVMNNLLRKALKLEPEAMPPKENGYKKYWNNIQGFYKKYLDTPAFKKHIPLHSQGFSKVPQISIGQTSAQSNDLAFANEQKGRVPKFDIRNLKPYRKSPWEKIHLFFIVHKEDVEVAKSLKQYFEKGHKWFGGLYDFASLFLHTEKNFSIVFTDKNNPLPEIEQKLDDRDFKADIKYIAVYVSPHNRWVEEEEKRIIYFRVKEMLLKRGITSQAVEAWKVADPKIDYVYSLLNIAVAMLAKLNGIPWRLHTPVKNELVVGVGAFKHTKKDVQFIGSAFSFNNLGNFNSFDYFMRHQTDLLAGCIAAKVKEYAAVNHTPDRLIIHFYKKLSQKELEPIEKALKELDLAKPLPIFIVTINKTEAEDIVAFDMGYSELMPESGTYINIGPNKYLLFNNTRYPGSTVGKADGFPFPIKLSIDSNDKKQLKDLNTIHDLIDQVYQFSRMYWKSVRQQNLPVTIKYPEMVAQIAPYFEEATIPEFGKNNLWFL